MGIVRHSIKSLLNGVSQQPPSVRLPSQAATQINGLSSVNKGLGKRPPTQHVAKLLDASSYSDKLYVHFIDRDTSEKYIAIIDYQNVRVFNLLTGAEISVTKVPSGWASYFNSTTPRTGYHCLSIADHTFITNKNITPTMVDNTASAAIPDAYIWVKVGLYSTTYTITIDANTVTYTTPASTGDPAEWATTYIAEKLRTGIAAIGSGTYNVSRFGSIIVVSRSNGANFSISASDSYGDQAMTCIKGRVQKYQDLPGKAVNGAFVKVEGDPESTKDNFYLKYTVTSSNSGVWVESRPYEIDYQINASNMPYKLVRKSDGTFELNVCTWADRVVGDDDTNPIPSIIGAPIKDLFFYRDRLGFLTDENLVMSSAGDYYNLWAETAMQTLDTDPIDVAPATNKVSVLRHAVPMLDRLLIFADRSQYSTSSNGTLAPDDIRIDQATAYEYSSISRPATAGNSVFFTTNRGGSYTGIMEYLIDPDTQATQALEVTAHVPTYIPANVFKLVASSNVNMLLALTLNDRASLYVYNYWWQGNEKIQSAWSKWTFDCTAIIGAEIIDSILYLLMYRAGDGVYLEKMSLVPGSYTSVNLDRRYTVTGTYSATTGLTTWTLPYPVPTTTEVVVVRGSAFTGKYTKIIGTSRPSTTTVTARGDHTLGSCYLGIPYTFEYTLSPQFIKEDQEETVSIIDGRLQLHNMTVCVAGTTYFSVEVTPVNRDTFTYTFDQHVDEDTLGDINVKNGNFTFPVMARADGVTITLKNDSHHPSWFQSIDWLGRYISKGKRI